MAEIKYTLTTPSTADAVKGFVVPSLKTAVVEAFRYQNVKVLEEDEVDERSVFGTAIFMSLTIDEVSYKEGNRRVTTPKLWIPCAIVEVNLPKKVVLTEVQAQRRPGSFKEHINRGDYAVSIKGILCNDDNKYPMDLVTQLNEIIKAPVSIDITHILLNKLGIYSLTIMDGTPVAENAGRQNIQPFRLQCLSDEPVQLQLKSEKEAREV